MAGASKKPKRDRRGMPRYVPAPAPTRTLRSRSKTDNSPDQAQVNTNLEDVEDNKDSKSDLGTPVSTINPVFNPNMAPSEKKNEGNETNEAIRKTVSEYLKKNEGRWSAAKQAAETERARQADDMTLGHAPDIPADPSPTFFSPAAALPEAKSKFSRGKEVEMPAKMMSAPPKSLSAKGVEMPTGKMTAQPKPSSAKGVDMPAEMTIAKAQAILAFTNKAKPAEVKKEWYEADDLGTSYKGEVSAKDYFPADYFTRFNLNMDTPKENRRGKVTKEALEDMAKKHDLSDFLESMLNIEQKSEGEWTCPVHHWTLGCKCTEGNIKKAGK